jgi:hypothetical protein
MASVGVTDVAWTAEMGPVGYRDNHHAMLSVEWERFAAGYRAALAAEAADASASPRLAVAPATDAKYRAVVRAFDALARGDLRALGTVHEDIQGSVDAIVARLRAAPPAPADARPMVVGGGLIKFDRPAPADDARIYPCADCGLMRSRSEGGTTFTVCDVCWDKAYPTAPAPDAGARIEEAHRALGKPGRMDDDGCCVGCGRSVQPSPCCPDFPVWPGPCRSCYAYDEEQRDAGAAERARRIEEALRKIANYAGPIVCEHYETCRHEACDFAYFAQTLAADTLNGTTTEIGDAAEAERAGRRGTNQAKRGNDARKGGEGA